MQDNYSTINHRNNYIPGEAGVWILVMGDMMIFALFFCIFVWYRADAVEVYKASQATLNQNIGAINTLLLLASSWFVVMAVNGAKKGARHAIAPMFRLAWLCGFGFGVLKIVEYREKIIHGITLTTNDFYMYYYIFTGIHFFHVLVGLGVLTYLITRARAGACDDATISVYESGATFWHMVDLLWIVLFPLIYLF